MKIAVVGKGGSGKSSISWLLSQSALQSGSSVLAVDADYNMDLAYCLGVEPDVACHINQSESDFYHYQNLTPNDTYVDLSGREALRPFSLTPPDEFTEKYSISVAESMRLMICGTSKQDHRYSHRCSHAYISPLKYYLPWLQLKENETVICDSVAGIDMVSYGLYLGADCMVTVIEDTPQSVGVFQQVDKVAKDFSIPHKIIRNKAGARALPDSVERFYEEHSELLVGEVPFDSTLLNYSYSELSSDLRAAGQAALTSIRRERYPQAQQWERHQSWYKQYVASLNERRSDPMQFVTAKAGGTVAAS